MKHITYYLLILSLAFISSFATARTDNKEANSYGIEAFNLALKKEILKMQFDSSTENLFVFEYKAHSQNKTQQLTQIQ